MNAIAEVYQALSEAVVGYALQDEPFMFVWLLLLLLRVFNLSDLVI